MFSALQDLGDPAIVAIIAALLIGSAGIPGLFLQPGPGQMIATITTVLAALAGLPATLVLLFAHTTSTFVLAWELPFGPCELAIDPLSAFFLLPIFLVAAAGSLFALGYWPAAEHRSTERGLTFFYGLLASSMAILVMARNGVFFLMVWEIMALSAYFLLVTEHEREDVRRAGIVYLIATHTGSAALFVYFSLLAGQTGSFLLPEAGSLSALPTVALVIALAAFTGFGAKAGIMPLHIWLPSAHANAPSHVSAMMSGVMLKMGLYGIFRTLTFFHNPPFTKLYSSVFLGVQRNKEASHPHEPGVTMLLPMAVFALLCLSIGLAPQLGQRLVSPALAAFMPAVAVTSDPTEYRSILERLSLLGILLFLVVLGVWLFWRWRLRHAEVVSATTWGCGYQRATARMEYTATSFSELVVSGFNGIIRQRIERPDLTGVFPAAARCTDLPTETVLDRIIVPLFTLAGVSFAFLRRLQHGQMHLYMLYIFLTLFILMLWAH